MATFTRSTRIEEFFTEPYPVPLQLTIAPVLSPPPGDPIVVSTIGTLVFNGIAFVKDTLSYDFSVTRNKKNILRATLTYSKTSNQWTKVSNVPILLTSFILPDGTGKVIATCVFGGPPTYTMDFDFVYNGGSDATVNWTVKYVTEFDITDLKPSANDKIFFTLDLK